LLARLRAYHWPGNVRELRNVVDAMVALADSDGLDIDDLPPELLAGGPSVPGSPASSVPADDASAAKDNLKSVERGAIFAQIRACGGNLTQAAKRLGIARSTLYLRLAEYREEPPPVG
jgi:DNA-binding NtrC family response regulator